MPFEVHLKDFLPRNLKARFESLLVYCERHRRALYEEFNQCPWFVDHGYDHVIGVLSNLDGILLPVFQRNSSFLNSKELFYLLCAALLHDIGMNYREEIEDKYSERSIEIRKKHGLYGAEMIIKDDNLPLDYDERRIIAEVVKYHQSKAPLTEKQLEEFGDDSLLSEPISETLGENYEFVRLRLLAALLQLADACDVNYRRARRELYDKILNDNKRKIREIKEEFTTIAEVIVGDDVRLRTLLEELKVTENPRKISELCKNVLHGILRSGREGYENLYNLLKKLSTRVEILSIQEKHYVKHQAVANVYFLRGKYIVIEPHEDASPKVIDEVSKEITKELTLVKEIFEEYGLPNLKVVVKGDDIWKKEKLRLEEDVRVVYRRRKDLKERIKTTYTIEPPIVIHNFINREREIEDCLRALNEGFTVVIYGIFGVGKTYLAAKIARYIDPTVSNTLMCSLRKDTTVDDLFLHISKFLALKRGVYLTIDESVNKDSVLLYMIGLLEESGSILVFDDIHVIDDNRVINYLMELIKRCERSKIILTSRVFPEFLYKVIDKIYPIELKGFDRSSTEEFLRSRGLTDVDFDRIYHLSDGHPLALNLISILAKAFPAPILEKVLEDKLRRLLVEEVYNSLDASEKAVLSKLSIYNEPVDIKIIGMKEDHIEVLESLIAKNLVIVTEDWRYTLHPFIRTLVYNSLSEMERNRFHSEAFYYYMSEKDYIKALEHAIMMHDVEKIKKVYDFAISIMKRLGLYSKMESVTRSVLEANVEELKGKCLKDLAYSHLVKGDVGEAKRLCEKSLELLDFRSVDSVEAYRLLADVYHMMDDYVTAINICRKGVEIAERLFKENKTVCAYIKGQLAHILTHVAPLEAEKIFREIVTYEITDEEVMSNILMSFGDTLVVLERYNEALSTLESALEIAKKADSKRWIVNALRRMADALLATGAVERAEECIKEAEKIFEVFEERSLCYLQHTKAEVYKIKGDLDEALKIYEYSLSLSRKISNKNRVAHSLLGLAEVKRLKGVPDLNGYKEAMKIYEEIGSEWGCVHAHIGLALVNLECGKEKECEYHLSEAEKIIRNASSWIFDRERELINSIRRERKKKFMYPLVFL
ncbi:MAG: hypothetical protein DRJ36_00075 [Thermoprotei archaeon]|nr:MAG: hypothetical protein DRJ36_00075 [Thermoprotei archaeon]